MIDLEQIRRNIIASEGRVPHAYEDTEGYLTIGVGHLHPNGTNVWREGYYLLAIPMGTS